MPPQLCTAQEVRATCQHHRELQKPWQDVVIAALDYTSHHGPIAMRQRQNREVTEKEARVCDDLRNRFDAAREALTDSLQRHGYYLDVPLDPYDVSSLFN